MHTEGSESENSRQSNTWLLILSALGGVFAMVWTVHGCEDPLGEYKASAYANSTLFSADLSIWHKEKNLTDSTVIPYLVNIGFFDAERNQCRPEVLVDFAAKSVDVLIDKVPDDGDWGYSAEFYQGIRENLRIAGAINRDPIERTAFIVRHYLQADYEIQTERLDHLVAMLPSDYGSYPLRYIFELIDESQLHFYLIHIGFLCGSDCRRTSVRPRALAHFPDELLTTLIKKYENKYNWAELTFTSSGTIYNGFKKAMKIKLENREM